jgi:hypothetical protein
MARNLRCLVCNVEIDVLEGGSFGVALAFPPTPTGPVTPRAYLAHEDCLRRAAHPDFNLADGFMGALDEEKAV